MKLLLILIITLLVISCRKDLSCEGNCQTKKIIVPLRASVSIAYSSDDKKFHWSYLIRCDSIIPSDITITIRWTVMYNRCPLCPGTIYTPIGADTCSIVYKGNNQRKYQKGTMPPTVASDINYRADSARIISATCSNPIYKFSY